MSGPSVHQHAFPKKRFQAAVVAAIDQHAAAIGQVADRVEAQGGVLADLAVARDELQQSAKADREARADVFKYLDLRLAKIEALTLWGRLRWLLTGK